MSMPSATMWRRGKAGGLLEYAQKFVSAPGQHPNPPRPALDANVLVGVFEERHQPHAIA
jgi:hypothetical protein